MSKFTAGPWHCTHNSWDVSSVYSASGLVAECHIDSKADEDTQEAFEAIKEANARLIAAAPDLLAVLEDICRTWDASNALHHVGEPSYLHRKARAAIQKATGGEG